MGEIPYHRYILPIRITIPFWAKGGGASNWGIKGSLLGRVVVTGSSNSFGRGPRGPKEAPKDKGSPFLRGGKFGGSNF